ncbi:hypothetical protein C8F01DRAFT_1252397 [Mycena amicta]|nr:hypothetical protein C8F01DRAFT_1252397 [Mycena amicta]
MASDNQRKALEGPLATSADKEGPYSIFTREKNGILSLTAVGTFFSNNANFPAIPALVGAPQVYRLPAPSVPSMPPSYRRGVFQRTDAGPAIGAVIGGVLSYKLGWRAIFWLLCIASGVCGIVLTIPPGNLPAVVGTVLRIPRSSPSLDANPLHLFLQPAVDLRLFITAVVYAVFYAVLASISSLFHVRYPQLNQTQLGLCFLSRYGGRVGYCGEDPGLGLSAGEAEAACCGRGRDGDAKPTTDNDFPIEKALLPILPFFLCIFVACCIGYRWCIERGTSLAGPLVLLFFFALASIGIMNALQMLMLDLVPKQGSSITPSFVSAIQPMLDALGAGSAYILLGGLCLVLSLPAVLLLVQFGPSWRTGRLVPG